MPRGRKPKFEPTIQEAKPLRPGAHYLTWGHWPQQGRRVFLAESKTVYYFVRDYGCGTSGEYVLLAKKDGNGGYVMTAANCSDVWLHDDHAECVELYPRRMTTSQQTQQTTGTTTTTAASAHTAPAKRGRGRPRKHQQTDAA